jgi:LL-diaminopimelate aminotransferase
MKFNFSEKVLQIKPLMFREFDKLRDKKDLIDLSKGLPIGVPPSEVIYELSLSLKYPNSHVYNGEKGLRELRESVSNFYKKRFNIEVDPENEIQILMGAKEGIANIVQAFTNPGDRVIVPSPCFPAYFNAVTFAGAEIAYLNLSFEKNYIPTISDLDTLLTGREKLMFVNYPHSPTGATCTLKDFEVMIDFAKENNILLCYDGVYRDICSFKHSSPLEINGAKDCCIELSSLSKTFDMCGWRIAYAIGREDILEGIRKVKSVFDVGQFVPIQHSAAMALKMMDYMDDVAKKYTDKINEIYKIMQNMGFEAFKPTGAFFVWAKIPKEFKSSFEFIKHIYDNYNVLFMPGIGFGENGEGFFSVSATNDMEIFK